MQTRLFFCTYNKYTYLSVDDSFTGSELTKSNNYRYWFNNGIMETTSCIDYDKLEVPHYDLFQPDFIDWLRDVLNVKKTNYLSDEGALKSGVSQFMDSFDLPFCWKKAINDCDNEKEFVLFINKYFTSTPNMNRSGGRTLSSVDGFGGFIELEKKGSIVITQELHIRELLGRQVDEITEIGSKAIVFELKGNEIYQKAFSLFKEKDTEQLAFF